MFETIKASKTNLLQGLFYPDLMIMTLVISCFE